MDLQEFRASLRAESAPEELGPALCALWADGRGDWDGAHELANRAGGRDGAWVHAYLHRKEGDEDNARYWYVRAGRKLPGLPLEAEWDRIAAALLAGREAPRSSPPP